jgi:hypothetical protein
MDAAPVTTGPFKRPPRLWAALAFLALMAGFSALVLGRKLTALRFEALLALDPGFYSHVSNLAIAGLLVAGIGYAWLMLGVGLRGVLVLAATVAAVNVAWELWLPLLNTRDPRDAVYGLIGVGIATVGLGVMDRWGMPRPAAETSAK